MRVMGLDADKSALRAFRLVFAAGLLLGGVVGVLFSRDVLGDHRRPATASPSVQTGTRSTTVSSSRPVAPGRRMPASSPPVCRDKAAQFVQTVRTRVDPDGDETHAVTDAALVELGHAALKQPSVLKTSTLVPFQRPRFLAAASQWLCH